MKSKLIFFLAIPLLAACSAPPENVEDRLVTAFGEAVLGHRGPDPLNHERDTDEGIVTKWKSPVRVSITEGATPENRALTIEKLAEISGLTGIEFDIAETADPTAPFTIEFSDHTVFGISGNRLSSCFARTRHDAEGYMESARVYIASTGENKWRKDCLVHEILHAVGWNSHTHSIRSVISYMHGEDELTRWDRYMLRALYDPRLKAGELEEDAMTTARIILREYLAQD